MEYFDRIISIGSDCSVAGGLRNIQFKEFSYPFDWNVTKLKFIKDCFSEKFKNFEDILDKCEVSRNGYLKYDNCIHFYHHDKIMSDSFKNKYKNRGQRLDNLLSENKKILFVRKGQKDTIKDLQILKKIIQNSYPNLKFKILLINNIKEESQQDNLIIHRYQNINCFLDFKNDNYFNRDV